MYYVYILKCEDNTLYTGYTNNIENRIQTHNSGKGAKYTRGRLPVELQYYEEFEEKGQALKREHEIKKLSRLEKVKLIKTWKTRK
ncbi:MAG: GIY-YIG nuclease family protein [Eubacteriales bacterium]